VFDGAALVSPRRDENKRTMKSDLHKRLNAVLERQKWAWEPDPTGQDWRSPLFEPIREAKAWDEFRGLDTHDALQVFRNWLRKEGHEWADFEGIYDDDEGESLFLYTWEAVLYPEGVSPLKVAYDKAIDDPPSLPLEMAPDKRMKLFLSVLYWLQTFRGSKNIFFPYRDLAELMKCGHQDIYRLVQRARKAGLLEKVREQHFGAGKAAEFRLNLDKIRS
jgi:hypothetical protein